VGQHLQQLQRYSPSYNANRVGMFDKSDLNFWIMLQMLAEQNLLSDENLQTQCSVLSDLLRVPCIKQNSMQGVTYSQDKNLEAWEQDIAQISRFLCSQ